MEHLVDRYRRADGIGWIYGQGSVMTGRTEDSDLDLVLVWDNDVADASAVPGQSSLTPHGQLALEQSKVDGYDVDLIHVPRRTFEQWMGQLEQGEGWAGTAWPLPVYVAAGLAGSELLLDPTGLGTEHRSRVQTPAAPLVAKVRHQLEAAAPGFVRELYRSAERENRWLHANLAVELHKLIYTAWFLLEGHYPPFPKYLPQWYEVHQATGMIAAQAGIGLTEALLVLRAHAYSHERPLLDVAKDVVARIVTFAPEDDHREQGH